MPVRLANLPNLLTTLRICILPLMALALENGHGAWAALILAVAGMTDLLDGWYARRYRQETSFGKLMDPVADKLMLCIAVLFLVARRPGFFGEDQSLSPWLAALLLAREFLVTGLRSFAASSGVVMGAGRTGKIKTLFQNMGLFAVMISGVHLGIHLHKAGILLLWVAVGLSYWSMVTYSLKAYREMLAARRAARRRD